MTVADPQGSPPPDEPAPTQSRSVALVQSGPSPSREIRVVVNDVALFDTAKFEHLQRIAKVMAISQTVPVSLCYGQEPYEWDEKTGRITKWREVSLSPEATQARCLMIADQALRWRFNPFDLMHCASYVRNRLMYEGKVVHAAIESMLGIRLKYTFKNDTPQRVYDDEILGVEVSGQFHDEDEPRTIEGTVGRWKTKGTGSPWSSPGDWKRQLRYMGAREWARAHAPGVMLGVIAEEEYDETMNSPAPIVPRHLAPPPPAPSAQVVINAQAEDAAMSSLKHAAEPPKTEAIRGRRPPPAKKTPEPSQALFVLGKEALLKLLSDCKTDNAVVKFQSNNGESIMELSDEDRDEVVEAVQQARRLFGGIQ